MADAADARAGRPPRFRFFNTYEPVVSLYRDLIPHLVSRGCFVDVLISKGEYRSGRNLVDFLAGNDRVKVTRTMSLGMAAEKGMRAKAIVNFAYCVHAGLYALLGPRVDRNLFLTQPPFFSAIGPLLSLLRRQENYCVVMDVQPQMLVAYGMMRERALHTRFLSWLTRTTLRKADGVIVIGRCMVEFVHGLGVPRDRIHLITNWADETTIVPVAHRDNAFRQGQPWKDKLTVMYAGNIGLAQYFDDLLAAADRLRDRDDIQFVFIGAGVRRSELEQRVAEKSLANVAFYPFLHTEHPLSEIFGAGDVHLVTLRENCTGMAVPSKVYGVMAAGRPAIFQGSAECETARMIDEEGVGSVVPCGEVDLMVDTIVRYAENREQVAAQGAAARAVAEGRCSQRRGIERYAEVLLGGVGG